MNKPALKQIFKKTVIEFVDSLIAVLPSESDLILVRFYINDTVSVDSLMNNFILYCLSDSRPFKKAIEDSDISPFLNTDALSSLFGDKLGRDRLDHFIYLWKSNTIDEQQKQTIWKWLKSFVKIAKKYQELD